MTQIRKNNVDDAIKVINEAIYDACENNLNYVKVEVPCTGKKTCKAIRDHFEAEGWTVKKEGKVDKVGDGDFRNPVHDEKVASIFTLTW